jgi:GTP 3',8-cyclase
VIENRKSHVLIDLFGRKVTYLRVSLTQNCNMKCGYCFASAGTPHESSELSDESLIFLLRSFASFGIDKVRFTGGEPLLRRGIAGLISETKSAAGIPIIGVTTNGLLLEKYLQSLIDSGLNRINISLDTLDPVQFRDITGIDGFGRVMAGIEAAIASGAFPRIKVNTVVMRGVNDSELRSMAEWALGRGVDIRFIEFMPTEKSGWSREKYVSESEMRKRIELDLTPMAEASASPGPAISYRLDGMPGRVSFISAVSRTFCGSCNRLRITSRGEMVGCLFRDQKVDLASLFAVRASHEEIARFILSTLTAPGFRRGPDRVSVTDYRPLMKAVGG